MVDIRTIMAYLSVLLDSISTWLFCCVISAFVIPMILERIVFYVPALIRLSRNGEVQKKGVFLTIGEIILWTSIVFVEYLFLYHSQYNLFKLTTVSTAAVIAWVIGAINIIYRFANFSKVVKKGFYYTAYMRFIKPEALDEYQKFIRDLDDLYVDDMDALLQKDLPYMHRQAVLRKKRSLMRSGM